MAAGAASCSGARGITATAAVATNAHAGSAISTHRARDAAGRGGAACFPQIRSHSLAASASVACVCAGTPAAAACASRHSMRKLESGRSTSRVPARKVFITATPTPTVACTIPAPASAVNRGAVNGPTFHACAGRAFDTLLAMPDSAAEQTEVLVVGAGPVGLTLAVDLGRRGVRCTLIEQKAAPEFLPKMERCNARTMEIFRRMGLAAKIRAAGLAADVPMDVYVILAMNEAPLLRLPYPSVADARAQIAGCDDASMPLEPYQLIPQYTL